MTNNVPNSPNPFCWLRFCEDRQAQSVSGSPSAPTATQAREPVVPYEFPALVYDVLKYFPDAMDALAKAVKEFYARRAIQQNQ